MALSFLRRHRRWLYILLWVVIAGFIIFYIPAFRALEQGGPGEMLAQVGGRRITAGEFQRAYFQQRQALQQMYGNRVSPEMLRSLNIEERVFQELVDQEVVRLEAERLGLTVDDDTLARAISSAPQFQRDGQFVGVAELRRVAQLGGMPLDELEERFRGSLLRERLQGAVSDVVHVSDAEAELAYRQRNEQVRVEYVQATAAALQAGLEASDAEIEARFRERADDYRIPERRVVTYALIDPEALRPRISLTPTEIYDYYRDNSEDFREEEQVCASHVLVKVKATPDAKEGHTEAEARTLAEAARAQIVSGADFAAVARKTSEDQATATNGGDLSCFGRGRMVPEFENAAFSLPVGQVSELVRSPYGFHVLRVNSRREERVPELKQVEERIRQTLMAQRIQSQAAEKAMALSAALQAGRSLDEAAREQGFTTQKSTPFARGDAPEPLGPALVARAFTLKPGAVDPAGARTRRGQAFIQLTEVQQARAAQLADARERVKADLLRHKGLEAAREKIAAVRAQAEKGTLDQAAQAAGLLRKETPGLVARSQPLGELGSSAALDAAVFELPEKTLSQPLRTPAGWAVLRVLERKPFDAATFAKEKDALVAQLRDDQRGRLFQAFLRQARERYKVERRADVFRRIVG